MKLKVNIDLLLVQRKMTLTELSKKVGLTVANLSKLKCGRAKAIRFTTLLKLCEALDCRPGDILELE
jgi:putative transcriptional regulator